MANHQRVVPLPERDVLVRQIEITAVRFRLNALPTENVFANDGVDLRLDEAGIAPITLGEPGRIKCGPVQEGAQRCEYAGNQLDAKYSLDALNGVGYGAEPRLNPACTPELRRRDR